MPITERLERIKTYNFEGKVDIEKHSFIDVVFIGDLHIGQDEFDRKHLQKYLDWIAADDNRYIIGMGDYFEMVLSEVSPKTAAMSQTSHPDDQVNEFTDLLKPLEKRIIMMLGGNHEERSIKLNLNIMNIIAKNLGSVMCEDYTSWLQIKFNGISYVLFLHHGEGISLKPKFQPQKFASDRFIGNVADVIAIGHLHKIDSEWINAQKLIGRDLYKTECLAIRTGGFLHQPAYAKKFGFPPPDVDAPIIRFFFDKKKMKFFRNLGEVESCP